MPLRTVFLAIAVLLGVTLVGCTAAEASRERTRLGRGNNEHNCRWNAAVRAPTPSARAGRAREDGSLRRAAPVPRRSRQKSAAPPKRKPVARRGRARQPNKSYLARPT